MYPNLRCIGIVNCIKLFQGQNTKWTDGSPLIFTKWSITGHSNIPQKQYDCTYGEHLINISCITLPVEAVVNEALGVVQPNTANDTRLCAAMILSIDFPWVMIPCDTSLASTLQICESSLTFDGHATHQENESDIPLAGSKSYYEYFYSADTNSDYKDFVHGSMIEHSDFEDKIHNLTCGDHCSSSQSHYLPYCRIGWIFSHGLCFRSFKVDKTGQSEKGSAQFKTCFSDGSINKIDIQYIANSRIFDYISAWSLSEIYLLDQIDEGTMHYKCRRFKMDDIHNEFNKVDPRKLNTSLQNDIRCTPDATEELFCFQEPITATVTCPERTFQCVDQSCISNAYRCDSQDDCPDGSDEHNCTGICSLNKQIDCYASCTSTNCTCEALYFQCATGGCIHISLVSWT